MTLLLSSSDSDLILSSPVSVTIAKIESPLSISDQIMSLTQDVIYAPGPYYNRIIYKKPRLVVYDNLNKDPKAIDMVVKYFWKKTLDKWLLGDLKEVLGYIRINNGEAELIKKISDINKSVKESDNITNKKIDYLGEHIITKKLILKALARYIDGNNVNWYDLPKRTSGPKEEIHRVIMAEIKDMIGN
jgi:hypothetical protein